MRFFITISLLFFILQANGQEEDKLHSRNKKAIELYKEAQSLDHAGNYYRSYNLLIEALKRDGSFDEAILLTHQILIKRGELERALQLYDEYVEEVDQQFKNRMLADAAYALFSEGKYEEAKALKDQIKGRVEGLDNALFEIVTTSIEYAIEGRTNARDIDFEVLPTPINTQPQQYFPSITAAGFLVYTVRDRHGRGDENLFFSQKDGDTWSQPLEISKKINSERNEGTASISADGNTLVYTACNAPDGLGSCDLYISYREGNDWSVPRNLGKTVNTVHWESQPSLSQDGRELYFVSTRPNGFGGQDIWKSTKQNGKWMEAVNLGPSINTRFDDCSPYIHPNGVNLFFASRGRLGFGGYDLYGTEQLGQGEWSEPENLGYPINNHRNQVGYTISIDGWAYYSDNLFDGSSSLYRFKLPEDLIPKQLMDYKRGMVLSATDSTPLFSEIYVADIAKDSIRSRTYSDFESGRFNLVLPQVEGANFYVKKRGYLLYKEEVDRLWKNGNEAKIYIRPIKKGEKVVLNDILFELNSAELSKKATKELDIVVDFIKDNPELLIEIGGHTDTSGEEGYNLNLSTERAKSVLNYFVQKGLPKEAFVYKGYGETQPIEEGTSPKNRRIEVFILDIK
ncbi:OmpA family protein [Roseivirga echinicomitans]